MGDLAIALAWVGTSLSVLSDGGRGVALGLAMAGVGLGIAVGGPGGWQAGLLVAAGGAGAALARLREGEPGWAVLRPGSTPRLILCVVVGVAMLWVAGSRLDSPSAAPARMAVLVAGGLAGARLISVGDRAAALAAAAALALAAGAALALELPGERLWGLGAGSAAALAVALLGGRRRAGA